MRFHRLAALRLALVSGVAGLVLVGCATPRETATPATTVPTVAATDMSVAPVAALAVTFVPAAAAYNPLGVDVIAIPAAACATAPPALACATGARALNMTIGGAAFSLVDTAAALHMTQAAPSMECA